MRRPGLAVHPEVVGDFSLSTLRWSNCFAPPKRASLQKVRPRPGTLGAQDQPGVSKYQSSCTTRKKDFTPPAGEGPAHLVDRKSVV